MGEKQDASKGEDLQNCVRIYGNSNSCPNKLPCPYCGQFQILPGNRQSFSGVWQEVFFFTLCVHSKCPECYGERKYA